MSVVEVRQAVASDVTWLALESRSLYEPGLGDYMIVAQAGIRRYWEEILAHPSSFPSRCFLIAEGERGEPLGFADLVLVEPDVAHLSYLAVTDSARGKGVASLLLRDYLSRNPKVRVMQLDVVPDNVSARALYDRLGFAVMFTTTWWIANLPFEQAGAAVDEGFRVDGVHTARAWMETYGFGEFSVLTASGPVKFGRPSARVLRCFDPNTLERPELLAAALREFPEMSEALVLAPGEDPPPCALGELRAVNRSFRMSARDIRAGLELA